MPLNPIVSPSAAEVGSIRRNAVNPTQLIQPLTHRAIHSLTTHSHFLHYALLARPDEICG